MKQRKNLYLGLCLLIMSLFVIYQGCGTDDIITNTGGSGGGWHPILNFSVNQRFVYTNDSITPGNVHIRTRRGTNLIINNQITVGGFLCYPFIGNTFDTATNQNTPEAYFFRYNQGEGKYYQYGIRKLINPALPDTTWDLVGNFDVARGTSYFIGNINYTLQIPGIGNVTFNGPLNGKIADSTTIMSTGSPSVPISCYRIEMTASISGSSLLGTVTATIILDYYLGNTTPTGLVRLNLHPFSFIIAGVINVPQPGFDRVLRNHYNPAL